MYYNGGGYTGKRSAGVLDQISVLKTRRTRNRTVLQLLEIERLTLLKIYIAYKSI